MATLEEMPLKFGQPVQLQLVRLNQSRQYARLVGYLVDHAVVVTMPAATDAQFSIREGDAFVCRAFAGRIALAFETRAIRLATQPFPHVYLAYPREVEAVVVRKAPRLAIQREAALVKNSEQGEAREPATVVDISVTGTCATAKSGFAAVQDSLTLLLPATKPEETEIRLAAIVRSARVTDGGAQEGAACQYGLEFVNMGAEETRAVERLIMEQLTRGL